MKISLSQCPEKKILPGVPSNWDYSAPCHVFAEKFLPEDLSSGCLLGNDKTGDILQCVSFGWITGPDKHIARAPLLQALTNIIGGTCELSLHKEGYGVAIVTLSDKGARGERIDASGAIIGALVKNVLPVAQCQAYMLGDDYDILRALLANLALDEKYDLVITTGGTGVGPRDITPQATSSLLDVRLPGFCQAMMKAALVSSQYAPISRAECGLIGKCLVINLPGSARAVTENLKPILPALGHTLAKIHGDDFDCGT